jgi:hypothetical protein
MSTSSISNHALTDSSQVSMITHPDLESHDSRSRLDSLFSEAVESSQTAETDSFSKTLFGDDDTGRKLRVVEHKFITPEGDDLTATNYINPQAVQRLQEDQKRIYKARDQYFRFLKDHCSGSPSPRLSSDELKGLKDYSDKLCLSVNQFFLDQKAQSNEDDFIKSKKGKEIPFFIADQSGISEKVCEKIRGYLNNEIVLDPSNPFKGNKASRLICTDIIKRIPKSEKDSRFLASILLYKEALRYLCGALKSDYAVMKLHADRVNIRKVLEIADTIKKTVKHLTDESRILSLIADEITVKYIEGPFQHLTLEKIAAAYIENLEGTYYHKDVVKALLNEFSSESNTNPAIEFERAIMGRVIEWRNKKEVEIPLKFVMPAHRKDVDEKLQQYMAQCQMVVGKQLFNDDTVIISLTKYLFQYVLSLTPAPTMESPAEMQARVFNFLIEVTSSKSEYKNFLKSMNDELWKTNPQCMKRLQRKKLDSIAIMNYMMQFYRVPFQTYTTEPTKILMRVYSEMFAKVDRSNTAIINSLHWKEDEITKIRIQFRNHHVEVEFFRRNAIGSDPNKPLAVIVQHMSIKIPRPGRDELAHPVSLEFYCEVSDNLSPDDKAELDLYLERISFILELLKFPPLKQVNMQSPL